MTEVPEHILQRSKQAKQRRFEAGEPTQSPLQTADSDTTTDRVEDPHASRLDVVLGADVDPGRAAEIRAARSAGNVAIDLALASESYIRRQAVVNARFIKEMLHKLPNPKTTPEARSRVSARILNESVNRIGYIHGIDPEFRVSPRHHSLEEVGGIIDSEVRGLRSAVIWLREDPEDQFQTRTRGAEAKITQRKAYMPHVVIGHKVDEGTDRTEILMAPLVADTIAKVDLGGNVFTGSASLEGVLNIKKVVTTTLQYDQLTSVQDALLRPGNMTADEMHDLYDPSANDYIITHASPGSVRAHATSDLLLPFRKAPRGIDDLASEEFDFHIVDSIDSYLKPREFASYNVQKDLHTTAIRLDKEQYFLAAQSDLVASTLSDPAIALIDER